MTGLIAEQQRLVIAYCQSVDDYPFLVRSSSSRSDSHFKTTAERAQSHYRDSQIPVFDEAASAPDTDREDDLMEAVDRSRGRKTLVIVTHRTSTIRDCDIICRVGDGGIEWKKD